LVVPVVRHLPEVIDPMTMVGVIVRNDYAIDLAQPGGVQLLPHVRPAVDENGLAAYFRESGRAGAAIAWLRWIAAAPVIPDPRHTR
jgi:hypothetical protein